MQEEVEQKTMALSVRTARLTAELLQKAFRQFFEAQKNKPRGRFFPSQVCHATGDIHRCRSDIVWHAVIMNAPSQNGTERTVPISLS